MADMYRMDMPMYHHAAESAPPSPHHYNHHPHMGMPPVMMAGPQPHRMSSESRLTSYHLDAIAQSNNTMRKVQTHNGNSRFKTELCRSWSTSGACRYGDKCQFAHGQDELRPLQRHPKYKTELCRTFHTHGICPYGPRCHFLHNLDEERLPTQRRHELEVSVRKLRSQSVPAGTGLPSQRRQLHTIADDSIFDCEVPAAVFASLSLNDDEDDSGVGYDGVESPDGGNVFTSSPVKPGHRHEPTRAHSTELPPRQHRPFAEFIPRSDGASTMATSAASSSMPASPERMVQYQPNQHWQYSSAPPSEVGWGVPTMGPGGYAPHPSAYPPAGGSFLHHPSAMTPATMLHAPPATVHGGYGPPPPSYGPPPVAKGSRITPSPGDSSERHSDDNRKPLSRSASTSDMGSRLPIFSQLTS
eukprot:m.67675 g.67675  ORF g.67675 m.67675 type:complete len:414 (-) comp14078_c0_seq1:359-1600(-)